MNDLAEPTVPDGREPCVMFVSCIGAAPKYFIQLSDDFRRRYRVIPFLFNNVERLPAMFEPVEAELQSGPVLIYHEPDWMPYLGQHLDRYEQFLDAIPGNVTKISIPQPGFWALWPFHCSDPRNAQPERARNRFGKLPWYAYGDTYVVRLLNEGVPPDEVVSRYLALDISTEIDLDNLLQRSILMLERQDRGSTVKVANFINDNFRSQSLFQTINHANNRLNLYMANQVLATLGCQTVAESALESVTEIIERPTPVHPGIAAHYGVSYLNAETRYPVDDVRSLTFAEYIRDYVHYEYGTLNYADGLVNNPSVASVPLERRVTAAAVPESVPDPVRNGPGSTGKISIGSGESVAYQLLRHIAVAEHRSLVPERINGGAPNHDWLLKTYAECLTAVRDPGSRIRLRSR